MTRPSPGRVLILPGLNTWPTTHKVAVYRRDGGRRAGVVVLTGAVLER